MRLLAERDSTCSPVAGFLERCPRVGLMQGRAPPFDGHTDQTLDRLNPDPVQSSDDARISAPVQHVDSAGIAKLAWVDCRIDARQNEEDPVWAQTLFRVPARSLPNEKRRRSLGIDSHAGKPGDALVLEAAVNGQADAIVTVNERHLREAHRQFGIEVMRPAEALRRIKK